MEKILSQKKVAIVVTNGFEQSEFEEPLNALKEAGAKVDIISLKKEKVKAWKDKNWGDEFAVDLGIEEADSQNYDALVLPGGVMNPDVLRTNEDVIAFVKDFIEDEKPVAAICHGPWTLIETGLLKGRKMTSYKSIKTDLINAGVNWVDEEVVVDDGLVTSRSPKDLPAFCAKMIEEIAEGVHH
ncbi:protease [Sphingobacteriaceae bacterium]|nr:protease [Sphingobacteriaceae bacterium]